MSKLGIVDSNIMAASFAAIQCRRLSHHSCFMDEKTNLSKVSYFISEGATTLKKSFIEIKFNTIKVSLLKYTI